ncbi:MAG TPA: dienelactone hydrolase family protein [Gemmatimonadaceae bacterium]|nr:dienelactone hydrolase family protein [Gemmatimonadaceae bacterium]
MKRIGLLALAMLLIPVACSTGMNQSDVQASSGQPAGTHQAATAGAAVQPPGPTAPAASPRHGEWMIIRTPEGDSVRTWVVFPERSVQSPVVLVVHEIFGLSPWIRGVADQLAAAGFIAVAPDLLTGHAIPGSPLNPDPQAATAAIRTLDVDDVHRQLSAVAAHVMQHPAALPRYGIVGFCWGGQRAFEHAARIPDLGAAVVYYGSSPPPDAAASISAPVLGLYGSRDARVNTTVPPMDSAMQALGKTFRAITYEGAGHGFLRQLDGQEGANRAAAVAAWPETIAWFSAHLERR